MLRVSAIEMNAVRLSMNCDGFGGMVVDLGGVGCTGGLFWVCGCRLH